MGTTDALLTTGEALKLNNENKNNQNSRVGERVKEIQDYGLIVQEIEVDAAANATPKSFTVNYDMKLIGIECKARAASASGTLTLRRSTTAISSAIVCAVDLAITRTASITDAGEDLVKGETLNIIANGAGDRGTVRLIGYRV